jgi:hypothetical protein
MMKNASKRTRTSNYIQLKIHPLEGGFCCCFHCWPNTWRAVNEAIIPFGPIVDEGDAVVGVDGDKYILECHESGPEIIVDLTLVITSANLAKSILDMITTIIKKRQNERPGARFLVSHKIVLEGQATREDKVEIDFPLTEENVELINRRINELLKRG